MRHFCHSFNVICFCKMILLTGFIFIVWQCYKSYKTQEELCEITRTFQRAARGESATHERSGKSVSMTILEMARLCTSEEYEKLEEALGGTYVYAITPTFARPEQKAELTRLSQTFQLVPKFHWIVVEDSENRSSLVTDILESSGLDYTHLNRPTPFRQVYPGNLDRKPPKRARGAEQRNTALMWIRKNLNSSHSGVVYFADDDNTYAVDLFREITKVKRVGVWPVGLAGGLMVERPICDVAKKKVIGFNAAWDPNRTFPIDMAGFAVNLKIILERKRVFFDHESKNGYQENDFLQKITTKDELECLADGCTKIYVWHTRTQPASLMFEKELKKKGEKSNEGIEV